MPRTTEGTPASAGPGWHPAAWMLLSVAPTLVAVLQLGRLHPDEVYQYLEPAYLHVFGYGEKAWEWEVGLRNWAFPGLLMLLLRGCRALGVQHPQAYRAVLALPQLLLHAAAVRALWRFVLRHTGAATGWGGWAVLAVAAQASVLAYAGRTLGEALSVDLLWLALEALDRPTAAFQAGVWLGLAVVARYPSATIVLGILGGLAIAAPWPAHRARVGRAVLGGAAVALALGALDWATWGKPFHSFGEYVSFNVLSGEAGRRFGTAPFWVYGQPLMEAVPLWVWPVLFLGWRRPASRPALAGAAVYGLALLFSPHREERFLYPLAQLLAFGLAPSLGELLRGARRPLRVGLLLMGSSLTWLSVPDVRGDQFRAIVAAARDPQAQGLLIVGEGLWGAGGYFYIGKQIPWLTCDWPHDSAFRYAMRNRTYNRAVTFEGRARGDLELAGFRVVQRIGREQILVRP